MIDAQLTTLVLLPVAAIGTIVNWAVVYTILSLKSFKHSFGYLSANQAIADALHSTAFFLYFCPMVLLDNETMKYYSQHCGFIVLFCYEMSVHTHFVISLNRAFAAFTPYYYRTWFSVKVTRVMIVTLWFLTATTTITFYEVLCHLFYSDNTGFFFFTDTPLCGNIGWYGDFMKNATLIVLIVFVDVITVVRVRTVGRKVNSSMNNETQHRNHERENNFLKQTVFQGFVFLLELVTYFILPQFISGKWLVFFCTSFAWVAVHAVDGLIIIVCNPEIRKFLFSMGKHTQEPTTITTIIPSRTNH